MWTTFGATFQEKKDNKVTSIPEFLNIAPALPWGKDTAMASIGKKWWQYVFMCFRMSGFQLILRDTKLL